MTFKTFLRQHWSEYLIPILGPVLIFIVSVFTTNIGWMALPMGILVMFIVGGLKTFDLYNRWYAIEAIMLNLQDHRKDKGHGG